MDYGRRNTKKYSFRFPDLKELKKLASFVLDPLDFKQRHGKLLSILSVDVVEGLLSVLVQFYDPLYRCFTFPDFQLVPTLEEYSHLLGIPVSSRVPFSGLEEIPRSSIIVEALRLKKSEIEAHWVKKGGLFGLSSVFLIKEVTTFAQAGSVDAFKAIFVLLIYGLTLFPNIDGFVDVNAIRLFLIGNPVPTLLGDMYFSLHLRNSKGGGTIVCCIPLLYKWFISHLPQTPAFVENKQCLRWSQRLMSLTNDDIVFYDPSLSNLDIIDSCGDLSNVPLIGTQGGINYNPALARRQLGFPLRDKPNNTLLEGLFYQEGKDPQHLKQKIVHAWHNVHRKGRSELGSCNCVALEAYTFWVKKRAMELKMPYPCERPMSMVVVEPLTLPNQDVEKLEEALIKMKQENDMWEERFRALSKKHEKLQLESKNKDSSINVTKYLFPPMESTCNNLHTSEYTTSR
ncbi:uncharacterized protein LOC127086785 [Lathyrus oleraceus]|uniref:DUF7745 domain-containing protein n=1 Tax=Pisum sativum TaxID=3888 RepID=A0A9D4X101_PEA|nr:uncharacterized protein LOC127086785 [Pisum sativum]XP_050883552.1 uncharacterized protein LOC127086785 [Pisum sativum]XP_050883553.1 uncharacterized protein LOC127086785 [Pisum sativum]KAI5412754.1 hypothetical protein KIW84_057399 [Pisum sativum]